MFRGSEGYCKKHLVSALRKKGLSTRNSQKDTHDASMFFGVTPYG